MTSPSVQPLRFLSSAELRAAPSPFLLDYVATALSAVEAQDGPIANARSLIVGLELHCRSLTEPLPDADAADFLASVVKSRNTLRALVVPADAAAPAEDDKTRLLCALDSLAELVGRGVLGSTANVPSLAH